MKYVGPHVSISGGVQNAPLNANSLGATAFGMFLKNQRQWTSSAYSASTIADFKRQLLGNGYTSGRILAHAGYLINLGSPDQAAFTKSYTAFVDELNRCSQLGVSLLNIHPGSHLKSMPEESCLHQIADAINRALEATEGVSVVLENTAGQGSSVGYTFEHLSFIIRHVYDKSRVGYCLDTCHAFAAGYDLRDQSSFDSTMNKIEKEVGFNYLRGAHLNDANVGLGSRKDRHQSLGRGTLGMEPFALLMADDRFEEMPLILETIDEQQWPEEIKTLKSMIK